MKKLTISVFRSGFVYLFSFTVLLSIGLLTEMFENSDPSNNSNQEKNKIAILAAVNIFVLDVVNVWI